MGKRRIRNLISLGYKEILGFDKRADRREETKRKYCIQVFSEIESVIRKKPDLMLISTPPNTHLHYVKHAVKKRIPFFTEVNTEPNHIQKILNLTKKNKIIGISSMTMRYHPAVKIIKNLVDKKKLGKIYFLNYHSGENIEDWHPWERVQDYYAGNLKTGGGRDQAVFELGWLFWIFGFPTEVSAKTIKLSKIPAKIFDTYQMTFNLIKAPLANVLIDFIQRPPNRILRIVFEHGILTWDWINGVVRVYDSRTEKWQEKTHGAGYKGFNVEEMYQDEISEVVRSIKNNKNYVSSFEYELLTAQTVLLAEKSSKLNRVLKI